MPIENEAILTTWLSSFKDTQTGAALLQIETGAFACSVLRQWGCRLHYPVALVCESLEVADELAEKIGIFQHRVLNSNMPPCEFLEALKTYHDDLIFIQYMRGRYTTENHESIMEICMRGVYQQEELSAPIVILFEQVIPEAYQDFFSLVVELEENDLDKLDRSTVECMKEVLKQKILSHSQVMEYKIKGIEKESAVSYGRDSNFWIAVISMLDFSFLDQSADSSEKVFQYLNETLRRAYAMADSYEFYYQIPDLFREEFNKAIPGICKFFPENKASEVSAQDQEFIFFDSDFYYIPQALFIRICEPLRSVCTPNQVKEALTRANILCVQGQERVYRTVKKRIGNLTLRVICLKRETLEGDLQEMSFLDMFRIRRKI